MALPETDSSMIPMNNTINGDTKPNIPPRNCILSSFVFVNITYPLLVSSLLSITTLSSPKLKVRKTKFNKIISWAATIRIIIADHRMIFCKLTYKTGPCLYVGIIKNKAGAKQHMLRAPACPSFSVLLFIIRIPSDFSNEFLHS